MLCLLLKISVQEKEAVNEGLKEWLG